MKVQRIKAKSGYEVYFAYFPAELSKSLNLKKGDELEFDIVEYGRSVKLTKT